MTLGGKRSAGCEISLVLGMYRLRVLRGGRMSTRADGGEDALRALDLAHRAQRLDALDARNLRHVVRVLLAHQHRAPPLRARASAP